MRIEIDKETEKVLESVKAKHYLYGKGHTDTVRFLVRYYREHEAVAKVVDQRLGEMQRIIKEAFLEALRDALTQIFQPQTG